jgi:hypothetical protein
MLRSRPTGEATRNAACGRHGPTDNSDSNRTVNKSPHVARGSIGPDGAFKLKTGERDGAAPGWYKVAVVSTRESSTAKTAKGMPLPPASVMPPRYSDADTSKPWMSSFRAVSLRPVTPTAS